MITNSPIANKKINAGEKSFTLIETVIAVGLMTTIILEAVGSMGNMVYFSGYSRQMTQAVWLAKRIMSQVEYHWSFRPFKEMEIDEPEKKFEGEDSDFPYTYKISVQEWKFPILELISGGGAGESDGDEGDEGGGSGNQDSQGDPLIESVLKQVLGDHILKIAHVEVFWPEGAKRNSVELALLLTNQREIDAQILARGSVIKQAIFDRVAKDLKKIKPKDKSEEK